MRMARGELPFEKKYNLSSMKMLSPVQQGLAMARKKIQNKRKGKTRNKIGDKVSVKCVRKRKKKQGNKSAIKISKNSIKRKKVKSAIKNRV